MAFGYNAGFENDPIDEVPQDANEKAIESSLKIQQLGYSGAINLTKKIEENRNVYLNKLQNVVTDKKWSEWSEARLKHRNELRDLITYASPTYEGGLQIQKNKNQLILEGEKIRDKFGFDVKAATQLRDRYSKNNEEIIRKVLNFPETPTFLLTKGPTNNPHPWEIINPPYSGWGWEYYWYRTDEPSTPTFARYLDSQAGQIGSYTYTRVFGADNYDVSYVWYRTGVRFWYKMPTAGIFELYLRLQTIYDDYWGYTDDEWGWSDVRVTQLSRPYVRVVSPSLGDVRYGDNTIFYYTHTRNDHYWDRNISSPGSYRWAYVMSDAAYPANQWICVEAGVYDFNYFWSNDVTVSSKIKMKWFVPDIYIRLKS